MNLWSAFWRLWLTTAVSLLPRAIALRCLNKEGSVECPRSDAVLCVGRLEATGITYPSEVCVGRRDTAVEKVYKGSGHGCRRDVGNSILCWCSGTNDCNTEDNIMELFENYYQSIYYRQHSSTVVTDDNRYPDARHRSITQQTPTEVKIEVVDPNEWVARPPMETPTAKPAKVAEVRLKEDKTRQVQPDQMSLNLREVGHTSSCLAAASAAAAGENLAPFRCRSTRTPACAACYSAGGFYWSVNQCRDFDEFCPTKGPFKNHAPKEGCRYFGEEFCCWCLEDNCNTRERITQVFEQYTHRANGNTRQTSRPTYQTAWTKATIPLKVVIVTSDPQVRIECWHVDGRQTALCPSRTVGCFHLMYKLQAVRTKSPIDVCMSEFRFRQLSAQRAREGCVETDTSGRSTCWCTTTRCNTPERLKQLSQYNGGAVQTTPPPGGGTGGFGRLSCYFPLINGSNILRECSAEATGCLALMDGRRVRWPENACLIPPQTNQHPFNNATEGCAHYKAHTICWCSTGGCNSAANIQRLFKQSGLKVKNYHRNRRQRVLVCWGNQNGVRTSVRCQPNHRACYTEMSNFGPLWQKNPCMNSGQWGASGGDACTRNEGRVLCWCSQNHCNTEALIGNLFQQFEVSGNIQGPLLPTDPFNSIFCYQTGNQPISCPRGISGCYSQVRNGVYSPVESPCYPPVPGIDYDQCQSAANGYHDCWCSGNMCNTPDRVMHIYGSPSMMYKQNVIGSGYGTVGQYPKSFSCLGLNNQQYQCQGPAYGCLGMMTDNGGYNWPNNPCLTHQQHKPGCTMNNDGYHECWCLGNQCNTENSIRSIYNDYNNNYPNYGMGSYSSYQYPDYLSGRSNNYPAYGNSMSCLGLNNQPYQCQGAAYGCVGMVTGGGGYHMPNNPCLTQQQHKPGCSMNDGGNHECWCLGNQCNTENAIKSIYTDYSSNYPNYGTIGSYSNYQYPDYMSGMGNNYNIGQYSGSMSCLGAGGQQYQCPETATGCLGMMMDSGGYNLPSNPCLMEPRQSPGCMTSNGGHQCWCLGQQCNTEASIATIYNQNRNIPNYGSVGDYHSGGDQYQNYPITTGEMSCFGPMGQPFQCHGTSYGCRGSVDANGEYMWPNEPCQQQMEHNDGCMMSQDGNYNCWCTGNQCNTEASIRNVYDQFGGSNHDIVGPHQGSFPAGGHDQGYRVHSCISQLQNGLHPVQCDQTAIGCAVAIQDGMSQWLPPQQACLSSVPTRTMQQAPCYDDPQYPGQVTCFCEQNNCNTEAYVAPILDTFYQCQRQQHNWCQRLWRPFNQPSSQFSHQCLLIGSRYRQEYNSNSYSQYGNTYNQYGNRNMFPNTRSRVKICHSPDAKICVGYFNTNGEILQADPCHKPFTGLYDSPNCLYSDRNGICGCYCTHPRCNTEENLRNIHDKHACLEDRKDNMLLSKSRKRVSSCFHAAGKKAGFCNSRNAVFGCYADVDTDGDIIWHSSGCISLERAEDFLQLYDNDWTHRGSKRDKYWPCHRVYNSDRIRCICQKTNCNSKEQMQLLYRRFANESEVIDGDRITCRTNSGGSRICPLGKDGCKIRCDEYGATIPSDPCACLPHASYNNKCYDLTNDSLICMCNRDNCNTAEICSRTSNVSSNDTNGNGDGGIITSCRDSSGYGTVECPSLDTVACVYNFILSRSGRLQLEPHSNPCLTKETLNVMTRKNFRSNKAIDCAIMRRKTTESYRFNVLGKEIDEQFTHSEAICWCTTNNCKIAQEHSKDGQRELWRLAEEASLLGCFLEERGVWCDRERESCNSVFKHDRDEALTERRVVPLGCTQRMNGKTSSCSFHPPIEKSVNTIVKSCWCRDTNRFSSAPCNSPAGTLRILVDQVERSQSRNENLHPYYNQRIECYNQTDSYGTGNTMTCPYGATVCVVKIPKLDHLAKGDVDTAQRACDSLHTDWQETCGGEKERRKFEPYERKKKFDFPYEQEVTCTTTNMQCSCKKIVAYVMRQSKKRQLHRRHRTGKSLHSQSPRHSRPSSGTTNGDPEQPNSEQPHWSTFIKPIEPTKPALIPTKKPPAVVRSGGNRFRFINQYVALLIAVLTHCYQLR